MKTLKVEALQAMVDAAVRIDKNVAVAVSADEKFNVTRSIIILNSQYTAEALGRITDVIGNVIVAEMVAKDFE